MLSSIVLPAQLGSIPKRSIHTALDIFWPFEKRQVRTEIYMEPLFCYSIERDDIRGVPLKYGRRITDVKISGYADDTAVYLRDRSAILSVVTILDDFAAVSGLQTNRVKSIIIELDPRGSSMPLDTCCNGVSPLHNIDISSKCQ